jgi:hypothetical protein
MATKVNMRTNSDNVDMWFLVGFCGSNLGTIRVLSRRLTHFHANDCSDVKNRILLSSGCFGNNNSSCFFSIKKEQPKLHLTITLGL